MLKLVKIALATYGDDHNARNLPYQAGYAVAYGLPYDEALKARDWNKAIAELENARKRPSKKSARLADPSELVGLMRELLAQVATISAQLERRSR